VRGATVGRQPDAPRGSSREADLDDAHDQHFVTVGDQAAQPRGVQQLPARIVEVVGHGGIVFIMMVTVPPMTDLARGTKVFDAAAVRGTWRMLRSPDDVLALMDTTAEGVVACVADAGATFLAPIFDELTAVVCLSGTPQSHIGIVSREYQVPCVMGTVFDGDEPADGDGIEVDCSGDTGIVRRPS